jgi:hypothetical protein
MCIDSHHAIENKTVGISPANPENVTIGAVKVNIDSDRTSLYRLGETVMMLKIRKVGCVTMRLTLETLDVAAFVS